MMTEKKHYLQPKGLSVPAGLSTFAENYWKYIRDILDIINLEEFKPYAVASKKLISSLAFCSCPAAKDHHHNWREGLLIHTGEVLEKTVDCLVKEEDYTQSVGIIAAIWHDSAKIHEYHMDWEGKIEKLPYAHEIGHVHGSVVMLASYVPDLPFSRAFKDIEHCILSHHGRKEWGAVVEPQTKAALALHFADMWSSRFPRERTEK